MPKKSLVLAEKPSAGKEIARVLGCKQAHKTHMEGPKYIITWAFGHLVTLCEPHDYDNRYKTWRMEDLPILPEKMKLKIMRQTSRQFKAIANLAKRKDIDRLIVATDAGREGELVARWIMNRLHWKKPFSRLWISSQTDQAIREGFRHLQPGKQYDHLYRSAQCRAEADWLIGLNVTRALTTKYDDQLAAGRVQTPTLAMLAEREDTIRRFRPTKYWLLEAHMDSGADTIVARWKNTANGEYRLYDEQTARTKREQAEKQTATVTNIRTKQRTEPAPLLYDLNELQRDANKRYGFSAKQTLNTLQRLYEQHKLVTYPRTDSRYLTTDMLSTLRDRLNGMQSGPFRERIKQLKGNTRIAKRMVNNANVTDHHAIIPTEEALKWERLSREEQRIYDLIARRFLAAFAGDYRYEQVTVRVDIHGETYETRGRQTLQQGWRIMYTSNDEQANNIHPAGSDTSKDNDNRSDDDAPNDGQTLPQLEKGMRLAVTHSARKTEWTKPPKSFSEAELLGQMETYNLGTPATRADIIEKLLSTDTIVREQNRLRPTKKGRQLLDVVADDLRSPTLTSKWERELEAIARGNGDAQRFLADIRQQTKRLVRDIKNSDYEYRKQKIVKLSNRRCPQCKKKMAIRDGKKGKFYQCRPCDYIEQASGRRPNPKANRKLIERYSDNTSISNSLGDALKEAMAKQSDSDESKK